MAQGSSIQKESIQVFKPSCALCVSDCDSKSYFTSCKHFLCNRCAQKQAPNYCSRCKKSCHIISLSAPNFPRELVNMITFVPSKQFLLFSQSIQFQIHQEQIVK